MGLDISVKRLGKTGNERLALQDMAELPEWAEEFKTEQQDTFYDWDAFKDKTGINVDDFDFVMEEVNEDGYHSELINKTSGERITIDMDSVPTKEMPIQTIPIREIACQRKGLNRQFYKDHENDNGQYLVWTKKKLEQFLDMYCDEPYEYIYPNGEKSGITVDEKTNFKKNIIDKFTEGKDVVVFDW